MSYSAIEMKARELRKNKAKLKDIVFLTGLSKDHIKRVTRDIYLMQLPKDKERARKLRREGYTLSAIAKEIKHSRELVTKWTADIDTPVERDKKRAVELREAGWKVSSIAREINRSPSSVCTWTSEISERRKANLEAKVKASKKLLEQGVRKADVIRQVGISRDTLDRAIGHRPQTRRDYTSLALKAEKLYRGGKCKEEIARKLDVSISFIHRHTRKIDDENMVDDEIGIFINDNGERYFNCKYLARRLDICLSSLYTPLKKNNIPYIMVCTTSRSNTWQKFFKFEDVLSISRFKRRYDQVNTYQALPDHNILKKRPKDLTNKQFIVFCALLLWKNQKDTWPSPSQIAGALYKHDISVGFVQDCIAKLEKKGYITTIREEHSTQKRIIVHKGPSKLITKKVKCEHCEEVVYIARDYVKNGATG